MAVVRTLALLFLFAIPCYALPDAPATKPVTHEHHFYDRFAKVELIAAGSLSAGDSFQTCRNLAHGWHEVNLPTQSCAGMVGLQLGFYASGEAVSFLLHKTGHHKLERLPRIYLGYGNAYGIIRTRVDGRR